MRIQIGLELNNEGRALAWALDFPGCFAYAEEGPDAVIGLARALVDYEAWINRHSPGSLVLGNFDLRVVDTWNVFTVNDDYDPQDGGYAVNAWFLHDWKPLRESEIEHGLNLLRWSRADLLELLAAIPDEQMDREYPGERWSIRGIARHIAGAEWWYLDRLDLAEGGREILPKDVRQRLDFTRARFEKELLALAGIERVIGKEAEFWSPRKLLRRALWHEINHYQHIQKLLR